MSGEDRNVKAAFLVTVGTSILNQVSRELEKLNIPEDIKKNLVDAGRLRVNDPRQEIFEKSIEKKDDLFKTVLNFVSADPERHCAELNTIIKFSKTWLRARHLSELKIILYPTDTGNCKFCAHVIKEFIENNKAVLNVNPACNVTCEVVYLKGFGTSIEEFFSKEGISDLLNKYARYIVDLRNSGYILVLMPVGGFKPECTYATIVGLLFGISKVVYVHETFENVVELPLVPIDFDSRFIRLVEKIESFNELSRRDIEDLGIDVDELVDRGLVVRGESGYKVPDWVIEFLRVKGVISRS